MRGVDVIRALSALALILIFVWVVYRTPISIFKGLPEEAEVTAIKEAALGTAAFLWKERLMDVISQALIIFSAIICAIVLIRREGDD